MNLLIKYISKLSLGPILIGLGGFVVFVSVEILYQLSDLIVRNRVSIFVLLKVIYYYLPYFVSMGIPVGVLLAIFWVLSQLSASHELMALQVHGITLKVLTVPFILISMILSFATYFLTDSIVPAFNYKADQLISKYVYRKPEVFISENVITKVDENQYFYVKRYDRQNGVLENVVLFRNEPLEEEIITARKVYKEGNKWFMYDGRIYRVDKEGMLRFDVKFEKVEINLKEDIEAIMRVGKTPKSMKGIELRDRIRTLQKLGIDPAPWLVELHSRYSVSLGPLIIVLVGTPLSLMFNLKSKSWGVILTFGIIVLYQGSGAWISAMGKERILNPILSAWLPNLCFSVTGLLLFLLLDTRTSYILREKLSKFFVIIIFLFLLLNPTISLSNRTLLVTANSVEYLEDMLVFSGEVNITYEDVSITCQEVLLNLGKSGNVEKLFARGNVKYIKKDTLISAQSFVYAFSEQSARMLETRGKTIYEDESGKKHTVYFGSPILDREKEEYILQRAYLTTCELDSPHYKIQATDVEVKENEYLAAYNAVLFVLNIPTIYLPVYFVSLKAGPDPFNATFGYGKDQGISLETTYNIQFKDGAIQAIVGWKNIESQARSYSKLGIQKQFANVEWTFNYQIEERLSPPNLYSLTNVFSLQDNLKSTLKAYLTNETNYLEYRINPVMNVVAYVSRLYSRGRTSWNLLNLSVKNFQQKTDYLTLRVASLFHQSTVSYSSGNILDHLDELLSTGRFNASLSLSLPKPLATLETTFSSYYKIKGTEFQDGSYLLIDLKIPFKTVKFGTNWLEWSVENNVFAGVRIAYNDSDYRISQFFATKLTLKPFEFLLLSAGLERLGVLAYGNNQYFSNSVEAAKINFNGKLKIPTTSLEVLTNYNLLSKKWDDLLIKTSTVFKIDQINLTAYTTTTYKIHGQYFQKTDYSIELGYQNLRHITDFSYRYDKSLPVDIVRNTLSISGRSFYFLNLPDIRVSYALGIQPFTLLQIDGRGKFKIDETFHEFSALYVAGTGVLNLSYKLSGIDPSLSVSVDARTNVPAIKSFGLKVEKDLHCWGLIFESKFSVDPTFSVQRLSFTFFIKEFPKKTFILDPVSGELGINVF